MGGIAAIVGASANRARFDRMRRAIAGRGEVEESSQAPGVLASTRTAAGDHEDTTRTWQSMDGEWIACLDGTIYNGAELGDELREGGHPLRDGDSLEVVVAAFFCWGGAGLARLRGDFALMIIEVSTGRAYLGRDPVGIRPLYWSWADGCLHVGSEVKSLVPTGTAIHEIPPGHHAWAEPGRIPQAKPYVDLFHTEDGTPVTDVDRASALLRAALEESVLARCDTQAQVGVVLSGGLDSSLVLALVRRSHPDCVAFTIGSPDSEDVRYARRLTADLGVRHEVIDVVPERISRHDVRTAIRMSECTEYGDVINAVVSVPLFARMRRAGIDIAIAGDGSDELFGGYAMYDEVPPEAARRLFEHKIRNLSRTELQRVDRTGTGQGVEVRVPFLDPALIALATRIPMGLKVHDGREKWILRHAFADLLPDYVLDRPKNPMSHSSGLHERARLHKPWFARHYRNAGYEALGPLRRDFSVVLGQEGHDLDRALAAISARPDHTAAEHARDLLGAVRWNAVSAARTAQRVVRVSTSRTG
ncbi:asparagine synthetase B family protein [Janibacter cremeus]|uniref:asparagine synthase (glutamine-hydrolyzing) n=1 Tax=Janibacter cremeus TaxID=1285192 RepID=A0A852W1C9_9MICO|nr:asparagine synthase-related protein [Janibacter cremeus]NYF99451.1 asparagine synthase (glutamine-hydrolyzing) [Janibacter cremeus]